MEKSSTASTPFLLRFTEPGPAPQVIEGYYDRQTQMWVSTSVLPLARTNPETSQPTVTPTNQSTNAGKDFQPDTYDDSNRDFSSD
jgi:hypothetical protein